MGPLSPGCSVPVTVMYAPRGTELGPLIVVYCGEAGAGVVLVEDVFGTRRYGVGAGPFAVGLTVGRREWLSAPL
jgi:hypothetical protein